MAEVKKIFNEAGHGGSDPGAVGYEREADLAIKITKFTSEYLEANYICEVYTDLTADSIRTVVARANKWGADLFMSNHLNAFKKDKADGHEALVYSEANKKLGDIFCKHVVAAGQNTRGTKYRKDLGVLRLTKMDAILNEAAFVDTWNDIKDWNEDHEIKKLAAAYGDAAAEYLKLPKKEKKQTTVVTKPKKPAAQKPSKVETIKATEKAKKFKESLAGTYKVLPSNGLNIRNGAGTKKSKLVAVPMGTKVHNYGYYTEVSGTKWLYVEVSHGGKKYVGFCSAEFLKKTK